jgi:hypothetical protein
MSRSLYKGCHRTFIRLLSARSKHRGWCHTDRLGIRCISTKIISPMFGPGEPPIRDTIGPNRAYPTQEARVLINRDCSAIAGCRKRRVRCAGSSGDLLTPSHPNRPPQAATRPGRPAPTTGLGTFRPERDNLLKRGPCRELLGRFWPRAPFKAHPPPRRRFHSMNSTPAASNARRMARSLAAIIDVSRSASSARRIVRKLTADWRERSSAVHLMSARAALI